MIFLYLFLNFYLLQKQVDRSNDKLYLVNCFLVEHISVLLEFSYEEKNKGCFSIPAFISKISF